MIRKFWGAVWDAVVLMCCIYMLVSKLQELLGEG